MTDFSSDSIDPAQLPGMPGPTLRGMLDQIAGPDAVRRTVCRSSLMTDAHAVIAGVPAGAVTTWQALSRPGVGLRAPATIKLVQQLLDQGVPVDLLDSFGITLLGRLTEHHPLPVDLACALIQRGASFDLPVTNGGHRTMIWERLLREAVPDRALVQALLGKGLNPHSRVSVNASTSLGLIDLIVLGGRRRPMAGNNRRPVPDSIQDHVIGVIDVLLEHGVDPNGVDGPAEDSSPRGASSPLRRSLGRGMLRVAQHLLDRGGRLPDRVNFSFVTGLSPEGTPNVTHDRGTFLHQTAAGTAGMEAVRWLVEAQGLDPNARTDLGATVLDVVRLRRHPPPDLMAYLEARALRDTVDRDVGDAIRPRPRL